MTRTACSLGTLTHTRSKPALRPIIMALGHWGARWVGSRLRDDELDASLLMWDVRRFVHAKNFPLRPVIIHFHFHDARAGEKTWWLLVEEGVVDLCREDPGRELTLVVKSSVRALTEVWTGDRTPREVLESRELRMEGPSQDADSFWRWLGTNTFADTRSAARAEGSLGDMG